MKSIEMQVKRLFIATDARDWESLKTIFADEVELDYSSMNGQPAACIKAEDILAGWQTILPGFTHTHHQIGNMISTSRGDEASVFCYGTATHYLENEQDSIWTVVGSYDFDLKEITGRWVVTKMKFNFKYQEGNTNLPQLAIEALK